MRLKFVELRICDFKSFAGEHVVVLDRDIGVHFIRGRNSDEKRLGSNGSGKTSIWDAFVWCLYGRTASGLRRSDIIPWNDAGKNTRVRLILDIDDLRYEIARYATSNRLALNGKDVGQEQITKLLGISLLTMTNSMLLGQGRQDLFLDMTASAKLQLLSDVKELDRWDARSKRASERVVELEAEMVKLETERYVMFEAIAMNASEFKVCEQSENAWAAELDRKAQERERVGKKLAVQIEALTNDLAGFDLKHDGAMTEVKGCEQQINKLMAQRSDAQTILHTARAKRERAAGDIERYTKELDELKKAKNCPTCGQVVLLKDLAKHRAEIKEKIWECEEIRRRTLTKRVRSDLDVIEKQLKNVQSYLGSFHAKSESALSEQKFKQPKLVELQAQLKALQVEEGINPFTKRRRELRKRRIQLLADQETIKHDVISCGKELEEVKYWPKGFKDIKLHIIEELLEELEIVTIGMLEEVGLVGWRIQYAIERETKSGSTQRGLSVMIASPRSKGKLVKWENWSGGERQRLRVVGSLGLASVLLNHAGVVPNIEVLDEPTTHLSDEGVGDLCDYLATRAREYKRRIFYADQMSIDGITFTSVITVKRDQTGSRIIDETYQD